MAGKFLHDELYRGGDALEKLAKPLITVCGAGAIGSLLVDNLARQGFRNLRSIDHDRIEEYNVNTQLYGVGDVGAWKTEVLRNLLFRSVEVEIDAITKSLNDGNTRKLLKGSAVVIDAFDNSQSRQLLQTYCREANLACLHVGLYADYCEIVWNDGYRVPKDVAGDVCEYPLARNLVLLAVAIAAETLIRFVLHGERVNRSATLQDFAIRELEDHNVS